MKTAVQVVSLLKRYGLHISCAESCTGGLFSAALTDVPGASEVFEAGFAAYSERIKHLILGVSEETLFRYTAVSPETAAEMAQGACRLGGAEVGISFTGYAGPGGGTEKDPVGTVYSAICLTGDGIPSSLRGIYPFRMSLSGDRESVRKAAVSRGMEEVSALLERLGEALSDRDKGKSTKIQ